MPWLSKKTYDELRYTYHDRYWTQYSRKSTENQVINQAKQISNLKKKLAYYKRLVHMQDALEFITREGNHKRHVEEQRSRQSDVGLSTQSVDRDIEAEEANERADEGDKQPED